MKNVDYNSARSVDRAKEVGVRKVINAARWVLARQFVGESILACLAAFLVAVMLSTMLIPAFNSLAEKEVRSGIVSNLPFVGGMAIAALFEPVAVLKGRFIANAKSVFVRKALVTVQFAISTALIIDTIVIYLQVDFMSTRNLGFSKNQMLVIKAQTGSKRNSFDATISRLSGVKSTAASSKTIKPLTFRVTDWWNGDLLSVKIDGRHVRPTLAAIEAQWRQQNPDRPSDYYFMDEFFDRQYRRNERFQTLF